MAGQDLSEPDRIEPASFNRAYGAVLRVMFTIYVYMYYFKD
jgi:hypothetical protein